MFCYRCGEDEPLFDRWSFVHDCCSDCVGRLDLNRNREQIFYCAECEVACSVDDDGCCTTCGKDAERRYK